MIIHPVEVFSAKITHPLRIALASDLHSKDPGEAIEAVKRSRPDLICVTGDMLHSPEDDPENTLRFFRECASLAPVFYTMGNHEGDGEAVKALALEDLGVVSLENDCRRVGELWIGGFRDSLAEGESRRFARAFSKKEGFRLLLCHRPDHYLSYLHKLDLDLVLSGHAHGGQIRLAGRGVYAPGQGFFCKYVSGLYDGRFAVTAGLANSVRIPRWNNPTELLLVKLVASCK